MAKPEFNFTDKFPETDDTFVDPRDRIRKANEEEKAAKAAKEKEKQKKPVEKEEAPKKKESSSVESNVFGVPVPEKEKRMRMTLYLEPELGEFVNEMAKKYHLSKNEVINKCVESVFNGTK